MHKKIIGILIFMLFLLLATGTFITEGNDPLKIRIHKNNLTELLENLGPMLSYDPESHDFGDKHEGEVDSTTFEIWNSGCCRLNYELTWNCSWVDVCPASGFSTGEHDTIFVDINTTGLVWGPYFCNILISSNDGNGVFTVTVNILSEGFMNITVYQAWEFLNDTANGIQIPIDVRTLEEWIYEHIDTPIPENPKHHLLSDLQNETKLQEFKALYSGSEIILYCKSGGRSAMAAQILVDNKFYGTICNMFGGITAWKEAGYPTIINQPPNPPTITGPTTGKVGIEYNYTFNATDPEADYLYYYINWSDDTGEVLIGPYASGEMVTMNHTWNEKGTYIIRAKARDLYDNEGSWAYLEVTIPRNRAITSPFLKFLQQRFLNLFPILQKILLLQR